MNISYNWLRRLLPDVPDVERLARILTDIGLEVEGVERIDCVEGGLEGVVVGHVLSCTEHPDSDHLHVTEVDVGGPEPLRIVCGAPNVAAGRKVLCATVGTTLYPTGGEPLRIRRSRIRGVDSYGMLCADDELGIGTDHDGIRLLPDDAPAGMPAREWLGLEEDYGIQIGLTPNRIDAASHWGVARDVAAWMAVHEGTGRLQRPPVEGFVPGAEGAGIRVEVLDEAGTPRYAGLTLEGCRLGPSPEWMQRALRAVGIHPKNNLVDITNFVMMELGQPLHAFDADKIRGGRIVVRTCPAGTPFRTLDGVEHTLDGSEVMICDTQGPLCIAGVLGGAESAVGEGTVNLFLESACFDAVRIRRTARRHGISTDASFRYERGVDPDMALYALKRAALLYVELAGARIASAPVDRYPAPVGPYRFEVSLARIDGLLGVHLTPERVHAILAALEIAVEAEEGDRLQVAVPPYRVDVRREADLAEELLRIHGYDSVPLPAAVRSTLSYTPSPDPERLRELLSDFLSDNGYTEVMNNSLTRAAYYEGLEEYPAERCVRILNPLSSDLAVLRQSLLPGLIESIALNTNRRHGDLCLYELGNCYFFDPADPQDGQPLTPYTERMRLAVAVTGNAVRGQWNEHPEPATFFTLRATAERLLHRFGVELAALRVQALPSHELLADGFVAEADGRELLRMGVVAQHLTERFDLKNPIYYLELDFEGLMRAADKVRIAAQEPPRYPSVRRDLALLVDREVTFARLREAAFAAERKLLLEVGLFDVYEGENLPEGKKSYALSFILEDRNQTLTDKVIERTMRNLAARIGQQTGATVRS